MKWPGEAVRTVGPHWLFAAAPALLVHRGQRRTCTHPSTQACRTMVMVDPTVRPFFAVFIQFLECGHWPGPTDVPFKRDLLGLPAEISIAPTVNLSTRPAVTTSSSPTSSSHVTASQTTLVRPLITCVTPFAHPLHRSRIRPRQAYNRRLLLSHTK